MEIIELTEPLIEKIKGIYPETNVESLKKRVSTMHIKESDVGEKSPIRFDQSNNVLSLNSSEIANGKYDLTYYMTTFLLLMTREFEAKMQGLRTGYFSGIASNLVGNTAFEDENDVEPGIDIFEKLRAGIADLSDKVGPDMACNLCEAKSLSEFISLASEIGLENPEQFLAPYEYLEMNSANLNEGQISGLTDDIAKNNAGLSVNPNTMKF